MLLPTVYVDSGVPRTTCAFTGSFWRCNVGAVTQGVQYDGFFLSHWNTFLWDSWTAKPPIRRQSRRQVSPLMTEFGVEVTTLFGKYLAALRYQVRYDE